MLVDLGEEVSEEKPIHDSIKKFFDKIELGSKCAKICNKLRLFTMEDLDYFEPEDLNDLPDDLLQRIEKRKLADKLATLQAEQFKIPQRPSGRATDSLRQAVKPVILGFFPKKRTDAVSVHGEAQQFRDLFSDHRSLAFTFEHNPEPTFATFTNEMHQAIQKNVCVVHLAGHGSTEDGLLWFKQQGRQLSGPDYEKVPLQKFAGVFMIVSAGSEDGGTVECVVLNASETETVGKLLRQNGVPHVVCWRSQIKDETVMDFAKHFYTSLKDSTEYRRAFKMASHFVQSPHLCWLSKDGNIDYVCLLSESGNEFPDTGHIRQESDEDDLEVTRNWSPPKNNLHYSALAGEAERECLELLAFGMVLKNGNPISIGNGLNDNGFILDSVLKEWGLVHTLGKSFSYKNGIWSKTGLVVEKARSVNEPVLAQAIQLMLKIENLRQTDMQAYIDKGSALCRRHHDQLKSIQEARKEIEKIRKMPHTPAHRVKDWTKEQVAKFVQEGWSTEEDRAKGRAYAASMLAEDIDGECTSFPTSHPTSHPSSYPTSVPNP
jgi:hypothetical protein